MWGEVMGDTTREPSFSSETREFNSDAKDHDDAYYLFQIKYLIHFLTVIDYFMCNNQDD